MIALPQIPTDPWFWAFLAAIGWALALGVVCTKPLSISGEE
jgi:hypothetical protein